MKCPRCQHDNEAGAKFCEECSAPLTRICAKCGRQLSPTAKFCPECAHPTGQPGAPASAQRFDAPEAYTPKHLAEKILTSKAALEGERKQVTVLFADLKGSMELLADRDPEEARQILDPVLARMMEAVHWYEGTVNQVMGDGIMALFGAPIAHEDHAVRACYAALRMLEMIHRYGAEIQRAQGVPVMIRVGLNSGAVVVRAIGSDLRMDYTAVGQTTHLAARMEQTARPGSVLITADTLRLVEGYVAVTPLGPVNVKGLSMPVDVYEVTGAGPVRTRLQASAARGLTRFVGRDEELAALRRALEQTRGGHGQVVAVVGEPGVGKSRLFHEFLRGHRTQGSLVLESSSVSYGKATAYGPVIDLLRAYCRIESRDDLRTVRERVAGKILMLDRALEPVIPAVLGLLDALPETDPFTTLDPLLRRQRTREGIKALLLRESRLQPLVCVFEDLHWIDSETQAFLDSLVDSLPAAAILLLVNYRPEYRHGWGSRTFYRQLRIDPFPAATASEFLDSLLGDDGTMESVKQLLIARTEGNPFFLEECARTLLEAGVLTGAQGHYRLTRPLEMIQVPTTVQAILAARIDRLAADHKRLLQTAAVIGKDVPFWLLAAIGDRSGEVLHQALAELQAAEFLYETSLFPELEYTFKHALTHEVAYESLLGEPRRGIHAKIIETIEAQHPDRLGEYVEQLGHHAFRAEAWEKAARYLGRAGDKATDRSAYREAAACYEQALAALGRLPRTRPVLTDVLDQRFALRGVFVPLYEADRLVALLRDAEADANELGDDLRRGRVLAGLGEALRLQGNGQQSRALGERAVSILSTLDAPYSLAEASFLLGMTLQHQGNAQRAVVLLEQALTQLTRAAEAPGLDADLRRREGRLHSVGNGVRSWLARALANLGRFDEAVSLAAETLRTAEAVGAVWPLTVASVAFGEVLVARGAIAAAVPHVERGLDKALAAEVSAVVPQLVALRALVHALSGRLEDARAIVAEGEGRGWLPGAGYRLALRLPWLGHVSLVAGDAERAMEVTSAALTRARAGEERAHEAEALWRLGQIFHRRPTPDFTKAAEAYRAALAQGQELAFRPLIAHCHADLGTLYRRIRDHAASEEHVRTATSMYQEMKMTYWLEKMNQELADLA